MFSSQSHLCHLFVLNRMKKVRFSTKSLHISAFLPIFTQNLRMSDYGNKHSVQGTGQCPLYRAPSPISGNTSMP